MTCLRSTIEKRVDYPLIGQSLSDNNSNTLESYSYLGLGTVVKRAHPQPTNGLDLTYITAGGSGDAARCLRTYNRRQSGRDRKRNAIGWDATYRIEEC